MAFCTEIKHCRICGGVNLVSVLNLGMQALTGVFPRTSGEKITAGPLELVWCSNCGLLQLKHSFDPKEMYGANYGYRSGLNQSMIGHLERKAHYLQSIVPLLPGDIVLDIGSNDATFLKAFSADGIIRIGIDPTGKKFRNYYVDGIKLIPEFFSAEGYRKEQINLLRMLP